MSAKSLESITNKPLALFGGPRAITTEPPTDLFRWPIVTSEDETAVLEVLRGGKMSGNDVSKQFETEFATWIGRQYALSYPNGTDALRSAMWAVGLSAGDEIICPTITYWASCTQALSLGVAVNFADIDPQTLCIDPNDIEHRIGPRTRAIMVVHYCARACDMDPILAIAKRHNLAVIEDVSHAQGTLYKGRKVGTFGTVAAMSMMTGKAFPIGEGGMLVTNDRMVYERCISYGFYERTGAASNFNAVDRQVFDEELSHFAGIPLGGYKHRLNQLAAAMGRVQLRHYDERVKEIDNAMRRFWSLLEDVPGIAPHLANRAEGSTMGGWYIPVGLYRPDELGGLPVARFCEAVRAEGVATCIPGINTPLHLHPVFHTADVFRMGRPTMISFGQRDVRQGPGSLPNAEAMPDHVFRDPWFKHDQPEWIEPYAAAFRKVCLNAMSLVTHTKT